MLYLIIIAVLIIKIFSMSLQISLLNSKLTKLVQNEALKEACKEEKDNKGNPKS